MLSSLRHEVGDARLTARTQRLLMLETLPEVQAFIEAHRVFPLKRQTVVTCIDTLNKVSNVVIVTSYDILTDLASSESPGGGECGLPGAGH